MLDFSDKSNDSSRCHDNGYWKAKEGGWLSPAGQSFSFSESRKDTTHQIVIFNNNNNTCINNNENSYIKAIGRLSRKIRLLA